MQQVEQVNLIIKSLVEIDRLEHQLPEDETGWMYELGLTIDKSKDFSGKTTIEAEYNSDICFIMTASNPNKLDSWKVEKYNHGDWENLIQPTLHIAKWLVDHGGLYKDDEEAFVTSLGTFKTTGELKLPNIPWRFADTETVVGIAGLSISEVNIEIQCGGKFVTFQYCISILFRTFVSSSPIHFIRAKDNAVGKGIRYSLITLFLGWWGIPWGPIYSVESLIKNLRGGKNITQEVIDSYNHAA